jgi:hypothetical protein|tara:strand:+ start:11555 stop:11947 length:393 start_codon:yes stop_codon:yes gene_type:complete
MAIVFKSKKAKEVSRVKRGERDSKYQDLIDAINDMPQGQAIEVECPEGSEFKNFYQQMSALRKRIDEEREPYITVSRTTDGDVAFIYGEEKRAPRKPRKKKIVKTVTEEFDEEEEEEEVEEEEWEEEEEE